MKQLIHVQKKHNFWRANTGMVASSVLLGISLSGVAKADWPVAIQDTVSTGSNQSLSISVLANDIGEGLLLNEVNTTTVKLGSASINGDKKSITYTPPTDFVGQDSFWYNFKDSQGRANATQVFVNVTTVTRPEAWPSAVTDSIDVTLNTTVTIPVLNNDGGVGLSITQVNDWTVNAGRAKVVDGGQSIEYTPASDYTGTDEFWYVFRDQWGRTNAGKVNPVVKPDYSGWPSAVADYTETLSPSTVAVNVLQNDSGEKLTLSSVNDWTVNGGRARIEDNYIRYTPPKNYSGRDSFWYNFEDAQGRANATQVFVDVSTSSQLPSIAFCGANYETDGTAENTRVISGGIDSNATELSTTVETETFPEQTDGNFAVVDDRRYYIVDTSAAKEVWMEQNGNNVKVATHAGSQKLYGAGIRDGVLYYATSLEESYLVAKESLYTHDGESSVLLGEYDVFAAYPIKLLANTSDVYYYFVGILNGQSRIIYRVNPTSGNTELAFVGGIGAYGGSSAKGIVMHDGLLHYSKTSVYRGIGPTTLNAKDIYQDETSDSISGLLDRAVVSQGRLLLTTKSHVSRVPSDENPISGTSVTYPAKLFALNADNEYVELAVCEE